MAYRWTVVTLLLPLLFVFQVQAECEECESNPEYYCDKFSSSCRHCSDICKPGANFEECHDKCGSYIQTRIFGKPSSASADDIRVIYVRNITYCNALEIYLSILVDSFSCDNRDLLGGSSTFVYPCGLQNPEQKDPTKAKTWSYANDRLPKLPSSQQQSPISAVWQRPGRIRPQLTFSVNLKGP